MGEVTESRNPSFGRISPPHACGLEGLREVLRGGSLARTLAGVSVEDRLAAAWTVVCGRTLAGRGKVAVYRDGAVRIDVVDLTWLSQFVLMRGSLASQLAAASGIPVSHIEFTLRRSSES